MRAEDSESLSPEELADSRAYALQRLSWVGITLLVCSILTLLYVGFSFFNVLLMYQNAEEDRKELAAMTLAATIVILLNNSVISLGAIQMMRGKNFVFCIVALCLAMVPTLGVCFVLGIPIGIWGLWTITSPEVRRVFQ